MADEAEVTPQASDGTPPPAEPAAAPPAESEVDFTDPAKLPAELQPLGKKLMGSYTKKMQKLAADQQKVDLVNRFDSDPEFAKQLIEYHAQRMGLTSAQAAKVAQTGQAMPETPPQLVEAVKAQLAPELQWMAPSIASAHWAANRLTLGPVLAQQQQDTQQARLSQFDELAEQLSTKMPGWETHEDDMNDLLGFLQSNAMTHRRWGSKLEVLARVVTGNAAAIQEASNRFAAAGRQRVTTGQPGRTTQPNLAERVRQAKSPREAFALAAQEAIAEVERTGSGRV